MDQEGHYIKQKLVSEYLLVYLLCFWEQPVKEQKYCWKGCQGLEVLHLRAIPFQLLKVEVSIAPA